jgi:hypothetical protein
MRHDGPSTYPFTNLREIGRTGLTSNGLSKPELPHQTAFIPYRTQEVAGSSPASSIRRSKSGSLRGP